jgi:hypothetical protein
MCPACWCSPGGLLALMGSANRVLIIATLYLKVINHDSC